MQKRESASASASSASASGAAATEGATSLDPTLPLLLFSSPRLFFFSPPLLHSHLLLPSLLQHLSRFSCSPPGIRHCQLCCPAASPRLARPLPLILLLTRHSSTRAASRKAPQRALPDTSQTNKTPSLARSLSVCPTLRNPSPTIEIFHLVPFCFCPRSKPGRRTRSEKPREPRPTQSATQGPRESQRAPPASALHVELSHPAAFDITIFGARLSSISLPPDTATWLVAIINRAILPLLLVRAAAAHDHTHPRTAFEHTTIHPIPQSLCSARLACPLQTASFLHCAHIAGRSDPSYSLTHLY